MSTLRTGSIQIGWDGTVKIEPEEQEYTDFDWFCIDEAEEVGHFTTAGFKLLPSSVSSSGEDLAVLTEYFEKVAPIKCEHLIDRDLEIELPNWNGLDLRSFIAMADRGLYSFDIETYQKPNVYYFRVATPTAPLRLIDIPEPFREIVGRTVLKGRRFSSSPRIPYEETLMI